MLGKEQGTIAGLARRGPRRRRGDPVVRFDAARARITAARVFAAPPALPHIVRAEARGNLVGSWVLPLELCPTLNVFAEWPGWRRQRAKNNALALMLAQSRRRADEPLAGRPLVRGIRFSSVEPDRGAGWTKVPLDRLTGKHGGLNLIVDDKPSAIDEQAWWEPAKRGHGFVLLELWTGEP